MRLGLPECYTSQRDKETNQEMERTVNDNGSAPARTVLPLEYWRRAAHYENLKTHVPSPEDWCVPQNMEGLEYLLVEPACEVNEKGIRE